MNQSELLTRSVESIVPKKGLVDKINNGDKLKVYLGIDPTSTSISLGNAVPKKIERFSKCRS